MLDPPHARIVQSETLISYTTGLEQNFGIHYQQQLHNSTFQPYDESTTQIPTAPQGFPVPPELLPMPLVQELQTQHVANVQQESMSRFSHKASIVNAGSWSTSPLPPPIPQRAVASMPVHISMPVPTHGAEPTQQDPPAQSGGAEPKLNQVALEDTTVQGPYTKERTGAGGVEMRRRGPRNKRRTLRGNERREEG